MRTRGSPVNGKKRQEYGCLVTFENDHGEHLTIHRTGPILRAVKTACAIALGEDESYRVVAYSTPETIATDLGGFRADRIGTPRRDSLKATYGKAQPVPLPESVVLGRCGLPEMLHPRLRLRLAEVDY